MADRVLIIDDDPDITSLAEHHLREAGLETCSAGSGEEGVALLEREPVGVVVLDLMLPGASGQEVLEQLTQRFPNLPVIVLTSRNAVDGIVQCMQLGALDYMAKPFDGTRLVTSVRNALAQGRLQTRVSTLVRQLQGEQGLGSLLGESPALEKTRQLLERAAGTEVTVLLLGESGTGKEVAARAIHTESPRHADPFVAVNCGAIPETLIESQLFGHERGAFTGADRAHAGFFEQADGGTLFLDEIGELRLELQVKLLRALQERCVQRLGASQPRQVDVRVIAATNRDLRAEAEGGKFRQDLYYRLAVFPVELPPLRERGDDVLLLARTFLERFSKRHGASGRDFSERAREALHAYAWPGNVRELENVVERAVLLEDSETVGLGSLPDPVVEALTPTPAPVQNGDSLPTDLAGIETLEAHERRILRNALELTRWNVSEAATRLKIGRATLYRRIERYGFRPEDGSAPPASA